MTQLVQSPHRFARFTATQVHAMLDAGILRDGEPLELIDGWLVYKNRAAQGEDEMTVGDKHNYLIKMLARLDPALVALGAHMQTQGPVRLSENDEPEPDGAVLLGEPAHYLGRVPTVGDAGAIIEVSDSSLQYDRSTKAERYARAGVQQYVIINIPDHCIEVYEQPQGDQFAVKRTLSAADSFELRVTAQKHLLVPAASLLP